MKDSLDLSKEREEYSKAMAELRLAIKDMLSTYNETLKKVNEAKGAVAELVDDLVWFEYRTKHGIKGSTIPKDALDTYTPTGESVEDHLTAVELGK